METQKLTTEKIIESLEYTAKFIPWSQSRSAKENPKIADYNLNWIVSIKRGQVEVSTDYMQGQGHIRNITASPYRTTIYEADVIIGACEKGCVVEIKDGFPRLVPSKKLPAPDVKNVLHRLLLDSDVLLYDSFEEWAVELGYDSDSRKDKKIYQACLKIALQVKQIFTPAELETLEEFFQDY